MEKILEIISEISEGKGNAINVKLDDTTDLRNDLEFDSFDLALLTARVEDEYDIDIFEDGIINTIGEIRGRLEK